MLYQKRMFLPTPSEIYSSIPLSAQAKAKIQLLRLKSHAFINKKMPQLALIVGPCSLHDPDGVIEYAHNLQALQRKEGLPFFLVMRAFVEKPRSYLGWKGFAHDPELSGDPHLAQGLYKARRLLTLLAEMGIPLAMEFVDPILATYFEDLITWGFIGARTSASQVHRALASSFAFPVGFKNSIDGNIHTAVLGAAAARCSHTYITLDADGKACYSTSHGNPFSHIVLRGSENSCNYHKPFLDKAKESLLRHNLCPKIMVDCAHGNSQKDPLHQKKVFQEVIDHHLHYEGDILGIMLESFLETGKQSLRVKPLKRGISVTDPCLGWEETYELILRSADYMLSKSTCSSSSI